MYQIYINQTALIITETIDPALIDYQQIDTEGFQFGSFYDRFKDEPLPATYTVVSKTPKQLFKKIKSSLKYIKAAGGLVRNEENKYLFIFRKGKWDLPKGKIDPCEKTKKAAVREVEEECGIKVTSLDEKLCKTYHIYEMGGQTVLKKTTWYRMRADDQPVLTPQLEEDITDARWLAPGDFMLVKQNTYPLIRDVVGRIEV
jgi:8-oxo-dGTP pyrophosphatase MutT (NUDIX family)